MRSHRRLLAGAAVAATLCLVAAGCDSSPYAASINGQVIKETAVNQQLSQITANKALTTSIEASTSEGGAGIAVQGQSDGSYSAAWSASVLTAMVTAEAVHQHVAHAGNPPGPAQTDAARAVASAAYNSGLVWYRFSPQVRSTIVARDADLAQVVPADSKITAADLTAIYNHYQTSLFTNVCVRNVSVDVVDNGGVDYPASLTKANDLVSAIKSAGVAGADKSSFGGSVTCYSHAAFEQQGLGFITTVLGVKAGSAAKPTKTIDGYQVLAVTSRTLVPNGPAFSRAVAVAEEVNAIYSGGSTLPALAAILAKAHVKIDPIYGTWKKTKSGYAVVPPSGPADHAADTAGAS